MFALSKNKRFLCSIKKEVQDLPWALWENEDIENSNYLLKTLIPQHYSLTLFISV